MSFIDGKPRTATAEDLKSPWSGDPKNFRCYLCGHRFEVGDVWRWVYGDCRTVEIDGKLYGVLNFLVCAQCDGPDVLDRWIQHIREAWSRFWWMART